MFLLLPILSLTAHPILLAAAVIPAIWLLVKVYRADHLEPEPPGLILSLVVMGVLSTTLASVTERLGMGVLSIFFHRETPFSRFLLYFLVVGLSEEGFKYLLLKARTWNHREFNCQFDGVVYAVSVSLGFALWENISYVFRYGLATALVRAVTAVPGHACFGVFMGLWYGAARRFALSGREDDSKAARTLAVVVPTLLHGAYDFIASEVQGLFSLGFLAFVIILFAAANYVVKQVSAQDRYL